MMKFKDVMIGQFFKVDPRYEGEWIYRGLWLRTQSIGQLEGLAVNIRQGCNDIGQLRQFKMDIPVVIIDKTFDVIPVNPMIIKQE